MVNIPGTRLYMEEDSVYYTVYESTRVTFTQLFQQMSDDEQVESILQQYIEFIQKT